MRSEKCNSSSVAKSVMMFSSLFKHQGVYLHKPGGDSILQSRGHTPPRSEHHMTDIPQQHSGHTMHSQELGLGSWKRTKPSLRSEKGTGTFRGRENYFLPLLKIFVSYPLGIFPSLEKRTLLMITDLEMWTLS